MATYCFNFAAILAVSVMHSSSRVISKRDHMHSIICHGGTSILVNKLGQIVMNEIDDKQIYIFDTNGQLLRKFRDIHGRLGLGVIYLTSSDTNEIITAQYDQNAVFIYTPEGKYNRAFLEAKEHIIVSIAFNHITKSVILLTELESKGQMYLLSYGPNAEEPQMLQLDNVSQDCKLTSHPNGLVALITEDGVIFI